MIYHSLVAIFWIIFLTVWFFSALGVKKDTKKSAWANSAWLRLLIALAVIFILSLPGVRGYVGSSLKAPTNLALDLIGTILCGLGVALAVWARWHLGRNWSSHPDIKQDHELITSGPYSVVRHPIYTGMTVAMLGTAMVIGLVWLIIFLLVTIMFIWRIGVEEGYMMQLFPGQYPAYKQRTWALIPYLY